MLKSSGLAANANPVAKGRLIATYDTEVQALVRPGWLTASQVTALTGLAPSI